VNAAARGRRRARRALSLLVSIAFLAASVLALASFGGCREKEPTDPDLVRATGTVTYIDLEGGFYGIVADDGKRYDPLNLEPGHRVNGKRIRFEGRLQRDRMTTRQWGQVIELSSVESL